MFNRTWVKILGALCILSNVMTDTPNASYAGRSGFRGDRPTYRYIVIVDAGSTGSRVHAFKFQVHLSGFEVRKFELELVDVFAQKIMPGLANYADDPLEGSNTIMDLVKKVDLFVPKKDKFRTPLVFRATAGFRLLAEDQANKLISYLRLAVPLLGYYTTHDSVELMSGRDEGIYGWYGVNFLNNNKFLRSDTTIGAFDMGGASMQITYQIDNKDLYQYPVEDLFFVPDKPNIKGYTHSYLKLGRNEAKLNILLFEAKANVTNFTTACFLPGVKDFKWSYRKINFTINGTKRPGLTLQKRKKICMDIASKFTASVMGSTPKKIPPGTQLVVFNTMFFCGLNAKLIGKGGGTVTVRQFKSAASRACTESPSDPDRFWDCMDFTYVYTVLIGLKMPQNQKLLLINGINSHEVGWPIGMAYSTVMRSMIDPPLINGTTERCTLMHHRRKGRRNSNKT